MYSIQPINSYAELLEAVRGLALLAPMRRVFRGQRRDYDGKMLVSSARRPSPRSLLKGLQTWLPAIDALNIAKKKPPLKSAHVSFTVTDTSPAWASGMTATLNTTYLSATTFPSKYR